jgi:hypothetical protein
MYGSKRRTKWKYMLVLLGRASVIKLLHVILCGLKERRKQANKPTNTERNKKREERKGNKYI